MALTVLFGTPGSGKTHAALRDYVLAGLMNNRRVLTNIEGLGDPERAEKLTALAKKRAKSDEVGELIFAGHSNFAGRNVFPRNCHAERDDGSRIFDDSEALAKFGSLVVWDEATAFETKSLPEDWREALTYHRHWAETGQPFDIVLVHQNWKSLAPLVRGNAEDVFEFVKSRDGKKSRRFAYRSPGDRELSRTAKHVLEESVPFDAEIFECYRTNLAEGAVDDHIAKRFWQTDYFKKKRNLIILLAVLSVALPALAIWRLLASIPEAENKTISPKAVTGASSTSHAVVADNQSKIVGQVPTENGVLVLVQTGDKFEYLSPVNGQIMKNGKALEWPSDF